MELAVHCFVVPVHHLEGMAAVAIHVPVTVRCSTVAEQKADLR